MLVDKKTTKERLGSMRHYKQEYFTAILDFVEDYQNQHGESPSAKELTRSLGIPYTTLRRYLERMQENDMLNMTSSREITIGRKTPHCEIYNAPLVGKVACGLPQYAEEHCTEYIPLPAAYLGKGEFFVLEADGESMIEAGIEPGDLVIIRQQNTANPGDIVVALTSTTDSEATLKRYYPEPKIRKIRLHPENSEMEDQYYNEVIIQGVAVKVIKDLEQ